MRYILLLFLSGDVAQSLGSAADLGRLLLRKLSQKLFGRLRIDRGDQHSCFAQIASRECFHGLPHITDPGTDDLRRGVRILAYHIDEFLTEVRA